MKKQKLERIRQTWKDLSQTQRKKVWIGGSVSLLLAICLCVGIGVAVHHTNADVPIQVEGDSVFDEANSAESNVAEPPNDLSAADEAYNPTEEATGAPSTEASKSKDKSNEKNSTSKDKGSNVTYVTSGAALTINGEEVFYPSEAYVALQRFPNDSAFRYTGLNAYPPYSYFKDDPLKNKAVELEKDFYWTAKTKKKLGISTGQLTLPAIDNLTTDETMARWALADLDETNQLIIKSFVANGTLTPKQADKDALIRKACEANSYISLDFYEGIPENRIAEEIAYAKALFGKNGCSSAEEASHVYQALSARVDALRTETGRNVSLSVEYFPVRKFRADDTWGVPVSRYNTIEESRHKNNGWENYFIFIQYDPTNHLQLDEESKDILNREAVLSQYIALKKREMDSYKIVINQDAYERAIARVRK